MLFRSEDEIDAWRKRKRLARGAVLSLGQVWDLAQRWYTDRMSLDFRGRTAQGAVAIFHDLGLRSDFWQTTEEC